MLLVPKRRKTVPEYLGNSPCKFEELLLSCVTLANGHEAVNASFTAYPERGRRVDIEVRSQDQVKVIKLRGRLGLGDPVDRLRSTIEDLVSTGQTRVVLDLGELATMDSSGIGLLTRCLTTIKQQGGALKLATPSKFVVQTLKLVGLINLFEIFDTPQAAVGSFQ